MILPYIQFSEIWKKGLSVSWDLLSLWKCSKRHMMATECFVSRIQMSLFFFLLFFVYFTCSQLAVLVCTSPPMTSLQTVSLSGTYYERNLWSNVTAVGPCLDRDPVDPRKPEHSHLTLSIYKSRLGWVALKKDDDKDERWRVTLNGRMWLTTVLSCWEVRQEREDIRPMHHDRKPSLLTSRGLRLRCERYCSHCLFFDMMLLQMWYEVTNSDRVNKDRCLVTERRPGRLLWKKSDVTDTDVFAFPSCSQITMQYDLCNEQYTANYPELLTSLLYHVAIFFRQTQTFLPMKYKAASCSLHIISLKRHLANLTDKKKSCSLA